jgi:hypothetical protein
MFTYDDSAIFTADNNQLVRQYLEALQVDLLEDYINEGKKHADTAELDLAQITAIDNVLKELDRNLQQIEDGIFE